MVLRVVEVRERGAEFGLKFRSDRWNFYRHMSVRVLVSVVILGWFNV